MNFFPLFHPVPGPTMMLAVLQTDQQEKVEPKAELLSEKM
jgi:hypothetical protein